MMRMSVDIETYSDRDIAKAGVYTYVESPAFCILLIGYKFDTEEEVTVADLSACSTGKEAREYMELCYPEFMEALSDPGVTKTAYNANFERVCLGKYFGYMPPEQWRCTMIMAATLGLPRSLAEAGAAVGLAEDKQKSATGRALISYFCRPCRPTRSNGGRTRNLPCHAPDKWKLFTVYNGQDVVAEEALLLKLAHFGTITAFEQELWNFDQRMNDRGVLLDTDMIGKILDYDGINRERLVQEARKLTGLDNPNSLAQLKSWLNDMGLPMNSVTKETVEAALALQYIPCQVRRMLEIRRNLGKTSTAKYAAMAEAVCGDHRLRGILQFYGANRSGRWTGRIVQVQNLPQNKFPDIGYCRELAADGDFGTMELLFGELPSAFSQLIRTAFIASDGCTFLVSDFSAIEARVVAWLADERWRLDVFKNGGDIYCASASQMFHVPVEKHGVNGHLRQRGKVAELALGYQGGFGAIKSMDTAGVIPEDEIPAIIRNWREASPNICKLWNLYEAAAKTCIREKRVIRTKHDVTFSCEEGVMFIRLPSGRKLSYWNARVEGMDDGREHITYMGVSQDTKKWGRTETYGGKLVENVVQAVARDCLAEVMLKVEQSGYDIVMHVHDEIVVDVPEDALGEALKDIADIMSVPPSWAEGLPLCGDSYCTRFYKKD